MPGGYPAGPDICGFVDSISGPSSKGTSVTNANGSYGSWAAIITSTVTDTDFIRVKIYPTTNSSNRVYVNVGVGGAGSEKIIINALYATSGTSGTNCSTYMFPCSIPAGSRVSVQSQGQSNDSNNVSIVLFSSGWSMIEGLSGVDALAATVSDVDPGATPATKGAYLQLVASSARDYIGLIGCIGQNSGNNSATPNATTPTYVDIAIGAGGSEIVVIPNLTPTAAGGISLDTPAFYPILIPAGTRISARCSSGNSTSGSRTVGLMVYGVYQ